MDIKATIIADSISLAGKRITTISLKYPRFIHSEFMTHRVFSRNASSSRAIPVPRQLAMIEQTPVMPRNFLENKKGMQAGEAIKEQDEAKAIWKEAQDSAIAFARRLSALNVHKQYVNRITEPFAHISVIVTATDWNNFFSLRRHWMAQPEIHEMADTAWAAREASKPKLIGNGSWHLPYVTSEIEFKTFEEIADKRINIDPTLALIKRSVAMCARVSYNNHDGTPSTMEQDFNLYDSLLKAAPLHASPAEHQAQALEDATKRSGNFQGWLQFRKTIPNENVEVYNGSDGPEEL